MGIDQAELARRANTTTAIIKQLESGNGDEKLNLQVVFGSLERVLGVHLRGASLGQPKITKIKKQREQEAAEKKAKAAQAKKDKKEKEKMKEEEKEEGEEEEENEQSPETPGTPATPATPSSATALKSPAKNTGNKK
jgi:transcriptional regulator with XRE-family HTH domain